MCGHEYYNVFHHIQRNGWEDECERNEKWEIKMLKVSQHLSNEYTLNTHEKMVIYGWKGKFFKEVIIPPKYTVCLKKCRFSSSFTVNFGQLTYKSVCIPETKHIISLWHFFLNLNFRKLIVSPFSLFWCSRHFNWYIVAQLPRLG